MLIGGLIGRGWFFTLHKPGILVTLGPSPKISLGNFRGRAFRDSASLRFAPEARIPGIPAGFPVPPIPGPVGLRGATRTHGRSARCSLTFGHGPAPLGVVLGAGLGVLSGCYWREFLCSLSSVNCGKPAKESHHHTTPNDAMVSERIF